MQLRTYDLRCPTSDSLDGSDSMNPDLDYSAAYVVLKTDSMHEGHGLTFHHWTQQWSMMEEVFHAN